MAYHNPLDPHLSVGSLLPSGSKPDGAPSWIAGEAGRGDGGAEAKAEVLGHALYEQLLLAHMACLRLATPVDQLARIDAQLARSHRVAAKYSGLDTAARDDDKEELDSFMTHYVLLLCSFKEKLQQHVHVHAMEAVMACWELE